MTMYFMFRYAANFYSLLSEFDPVYLEMQSFLESSLESARLEGEKVIILGHIPVGTSTTVDFSDWFSQLILQYADTVVLHLYGHTHRDFFTLVSIVILYSIKQYISSNHSLLQSHIN